MVAVNGKRHGDQLLSRGSSGDSNNSKKILLKVLDDAATYRAFKGCFSDILSRLWGRIEVLMTQRQFLIINEHILLVFDEQFEEIATKTKEIRFCAPQPFSVAENGLKLFFEHYCIVSSINLESNKL